MGICEYPVLLMRERASRISASGLKVATSLCGRSDSALGGVCEQALKVLQLVDDLWVRGSNGLVVVVAAMRDGVAQVGNIFELLRLALAEEVFVVGAIDHPPEGI